jgi:pilus assembly protein CpaB
MQPPTPAATEGQPAPPPVVMETILIAGRDLQAGALLKPDDLGTVQVPHDKMPDGAGTDTSANRRSLVGGMIRRRIAAGEVVLVRDLLRPGEHGFLAAVLSPGMRAVTIGVDAITGSAGLIWPGDHVDVLLTHELNEPGRPVGQRVAAETVLADVRVIAIDQQLVQGAAPGAADGKAATTVTLEVTPRQSEQVSVATRLGRLSLVVRAARSSETELDDRRLGSMDDTTPPKSGITWAGDVSPALTTGAVATKPAPNVVRIFRGASEGQEYKF